MKLKSTTRAFWQGVFASLVASVFLEGARYLATRAEESAEQGAMDVDLPPLPFIDDLDPFVRLALLAAVGFFVALLLFLGLQKTGLKMAAVVLPALAVGAIIGAYFWLVF